MTDETVTLARDDAQRIFDLAVGADQAASGFMETDDVAAMRRLAVAIGADPKECTGVEFVAQFPHEYLPGVPDLSEHRQTVSEGRPDIGVASGITVTRPETDREILKRLGVTPREVCVVGRWKGRCGKAENDPIHEVVR